MSSSIDSKGGRSSPSFIKYFPRVKSYTGCEKATVIVGRMEFWFSKYQAGFYKFLEPCPHRLYREGDSWSEELGFSRKVFNRAFDLIGVRYKSKSEYLASDDKFQGKFYASYHDRKTNRTFFVRNHTVANAFFGSRGGAQLEGVSVSQSLNVSQPQGKKSPQQKIHSQVMDPASNTNSVSGGAQDELLRAVPGTAQIGRSYKNSLKQKKTSSLDAIPVRDSHKKPEDFEKLTEGMILIWKEEVGDLGVESISRPLLDRLYQTLSRFFSGSLEVWKAFCRKIASSKFLMGEAKNRFFKKAWITWAIKEESIELIHAGHFNCGDREIAKSSDVVEVESQIHEMRTKKDNLLIAKTRIEDEVRQKRKAAVRSAMTEITSEDLQDARASFEREMRTQDTVTGHDFREMSWNMPFAETLFEMFLMSQLESQLFLESLDVHSEQALATSGIQLQLEQIEAQETQLITTLHALIDANTVGLNAATNRNEFSRNGDVSAVA